jgi:lycopene elongase/hydratase (dihydrobisanhydrobacterioruberin-forming)
MTKLIDISRPRFWLYVFGHYIVGLAAGAQSSADFLRIDAILFGVYFLLPANLLVYGVNDIFDFETDRLNPKKAEYEMLVEPKLHRSLSYSIVALNAPFIIAAILLAPSAVPALLVFVILAVFYSAPPIRAKEVPFLDSLFNILYVFPGVFAYQLLTREFPPLAVLLAAASWTAAMHAYSAIPDMAADTSAGMKTIATTLGVRGTHLFCVGCYVLAAILCTTFAPILAIIAAAYVVLMCISLYSMDVFGWYRSFAVINAACGFIIFWYLALPKFL